MNEKPIREEILNEIRELRLQTSELLIKVELSNQLCLNILNTLQEGKNV